MILSSVTLFISIIALAVAVYVCKSIHALPKVNISEGEIWKTELQLPKGVRPYPGEHALKHRKQKNEMDD